MRTPSVLLSNRFIKTPLLMALGLVISGAAMADQAPEQQGKLDSLLNQNG